MRGNNCREVPCNLKEGRRGMLYYAIAYAAKKYTDKDHPRDIIEFYDIITSMFGLDENGDEIEIGDKKTLTRYMDALESFTNLASRYGRQDRFETIVRVMMGGRINHVGESPILYYFTGDNGFKPSKEDLEASVAEIADSFYYGDNLAFGYDSFINDMQKSSVPGFRSNNFHGITDVMKG